MNTEKEINKIYNQESKEMKSWVLGGFLGSHHWNSKNYFAIFMYPILFLIFIVCSCLFGYELIMNILTLQQSQMDITAFASDPNYIENNILEKVIPYHYFYGLIISILILMVWWLYDLYLIEKRYEKQLNLLTNNNKRKSIFIAYLLWIFIGAFGVHRFYAGQFYTGLVFLFCTLTSWTIITGLIVLIWYMIDVFYLYSYIIDKNKENIINTQ